MHPQPIKLLIFVEHVSRELDVACVLKYLLLRRHGCSTEIAAINWDLSRTLKRFQPAVVAVPYCYSARPDDPGLAQMRAAWPRATWVNLAYEQVLQPINEDFKVPRDAFARHQVLHHAWGDFYADLLHRHGVSRPQILMNGNPTLALYQDPYRAYFESRTSLADRHGLNVRAPWVFVPENYGAAFMSDRSFRDHVRRGYHADQGRTYRQFASASLREVIRWLQRLAETTEAEVIVRPRPMTPLAAFERVCRQAMGRGVVARFHLIKNGTVREWVLASDLVLSSYSTTLIEAAVAQRPVALLAPLPFPGFVEAEWYGAVPRLDTFASLARFATDHSWQDVSWPRLKAWAEARMLSRGDPLARLADLLNAVVSGDRPVALPEDSREATASGEGDPAGAPPSWVTGSGRQLIAGLRVQWRQKIHERLHERDRLSSADIDRRVARWSEVLEAPTLASVAAHA